MFYLTLNFFLTNKETIDSVIFFHMQNFISKNETSLGTDCDGNRRKEPTTQNKEKRGYSRKTK